MSDIVVGATVAPFKATSREVTQWLASAKELTEDARSAGFTNVHYFVAIEHDGRGLAPFTELLTRLTAVNKIPGASAAYWTFSICDHNDTVTTANRLIRICTGRNLIHEFALRSPDTSHVLFLDSDLIVPGDSISKLLEVNHPIVGGDVPSYCLGGPKSKKHNFPVQQHWNTAGFLLVERDVIRQVRWRADDHIGGSGCTDDPCFAYDVEKICGHQTLVRKDVIGVHRPLVPLEKRGHDLNLVGQVG